MLPPVGPFGLGVVGCAGAAGGAVLVCVGTLGTLATGALAPTCCAGGWVGAGDDGGADGFGGERLAVDVSVLFGDGEAPIK